MTALIVPPCHQVIKQFSTLYADCAALARRPIPVDNGYYRSPLQPCLPQGLLKTGKGDGDGGQTLLEVDRFMQRSPSVMVRF